MLPIRLPRRLSSLTKLSQHNSGAETAVGFQHVRRQNMPKVTTQSDLEDTVNKALSSARDVQRFGAYRSGRLLEHFRLQWL